MSSDNASSSLSQPSLNRTEQCGEDWDGANANPMKPNSVAFPGEGGVEEGTPLPVGSKTNRTLSDLLRLHAEKGTRFTCSPEEASRLADVLGQWVSTQVPTLRPLGIGV